MSFKISSIASVMSLLILMGSLSGCVFDDLGRTLRESLKAPKAGTVVVCVPELPVPPDSVIDALDDAAHHDPKAKQWGGDLERHYQFQDAARPKCAARHG